VNHPIIAIIFLALAGVLGDFFLKMAGHGSKYLDWKWFVPGLVVYASLSYAWFYVMKNVKLSTVAVVYSLFTILFLVAIGTFYFHEKLNVYEVVGIIAAITSVILLSRFA